MCKIKIIIAGSRNYDDITAVTNFVDHIIRLRVYRKGYSHSDIEIVCGMAKGADKLGEQYAKRQGYKLKYFPADWNSFGKAAGYIRNKQMAEYASYQKGYGALIAFWDGESKGTKDMINIAKEYGLKVFIYNFKNNTGKEI